MQCREKTKHFRARRSPGVLAYVSLILLVLFFSGCSKYLGEAFAWFDYSTLLGRFGTVEGMRNFLGSHGEGVSYGMIYGAALIPGIMLALGAIELATRGGALEAAHVLLNPILRPLLGLPGSCGVAIVTNLQSSDASAVMTRELYEQGRLTDDERTVLCSFEYSSSACVIIYLTIACVLFPFLSINYLAPLGVIVLCKLIGANLTRLYLKRCRK